MTFKLSHPHGINTVKLNSVSRLRLLTFNPNSIGKNPKRAQIFEFLKKKDAEWGGQAIFGSFTSQSRGVAVFLKKDVAIEVVENSIFRDPSGNFVVLNVKFENSVITLGCIYGPNVDDPAFFEKTVAKLFIGQYS